eukprot:gene10462-11560_t
MAPFFHSILRIASCNKRIVEKSALLVPPLGMAAAISLRSRSQQVNAVQLLLSMFLYHSSWTPESFG